MKLLGNSLAGAPSAVWSALDRLDVFAAGPGNTVWQWWFDGAAWFGPGPLAAVPGGIPAEGICAVSSGARRIEVFAAAPGANCVGPRNTPWWWRWNGTIWSAPIPLPSGADLPAERLAVVSPRPGRLDVFAAGRAGNQLDCPDIGG